MVPWYIYIYIYIYIYRLGFTHIIKDYGSIIYIYMVTVVPYGYMTVQDIWHYF